MCLCYSSNFCPLCICTYVRTHCLYVSKTYVILSNSNLCLLWVVYFGQSTICNLSWIQRWLTSILCSICLWTTVHASNTNAQYHFMFMHGSTVLGVFSTLHSSCMCMYTFWVSTYSSTILYSYSIYYACQLIIYIYIYIYIHIYSPSSIVLEKRYVIACIDTI